MHNNSSKLWDRRTWEFPLIHHFTYTFGLSLENSAKESTIILIQITQSEKMQSDYDKQ